MEEIMAEKENKTIIFVETKKRCDDLTRRMRRDGWKWHNMILIILEWIMQIFDGQKLFSVSNPAVSLWFCVVGGQPCVSMETKASQKETGYSQVRRLVM